MPIFISRQGIYSLYKLWLKDLNKLFIQQLQISHKSCTLSELSSKLSREIKPRRGKRCESRIFILTPRAWINTLLVHNKEY